MTATAMKPNGFVQRIETLLGDVRYLRATSEADLETLGRLRYTANLREGTIGPDSTRSLRDHYDTSSNCLNMGILLDGAAVGTLRIHVVSREQPESVLMGAYPDIVSAYIERGARIVELTRLAVDFDAGRQNPGLAYVATRLALVAARHFDADFLMAGVRREHLPFYRREINALPLSPPRPYPSLLKPLALFGCDYRLNFPVILERRGFYDSTKAEREALFGPVSPMESRESSALAYRLPA